MQSSATTPTQRVNLIRSIAGHAEGRETDALTEIRAVLDGMTLEEIAAMRVIAAREVGA